MINAAIKKFLFLHHHVSLPGIGSFSIEKKPARINVTDRVIEPPSSVIRFSNENSPAEKIFYNFLAHELNIDELQAVRTFTDFNIHLQSDIKQNKSVEFSGIGSLHADDETLTFVPEKLPNYYPPIAAERVIRKNVSHVIKVGEEEKTSEEMQTVLQQEEIVHKDRWWIPAAILGAVGIVAIVVYYVFISK